MNEQAKMEEAHAQRRLPDSIDETTDVAELESRRAAQESVFSTLASAGVARGSATTGWPTKSQLIPAACM